MTSRREEQRVWLIFVRLPIAVHQSTVVSMERNSSSVGDGLFVVCDVEYAHECSTLESNCQHGKRHVQIAELNFDLLPVF